METPGNNPYSATTATTHSPNAMNLTDNQRMFAWIALGAGVIALIWGLMRTPDTGSAYKTSPSNEQRDGSSKANTP